MRRTQIREHVFKLLFRVEFHDSSEMAEQEELYFDDFELLAEDEKAYIEARLAKIMEVLPDIDTKLQEITVGWKKNRIGKAELTILRLALYEIIYDDEIPAPIAINEAVELTKKYCGDGAPAFVNGILGKMTK